MYARRTGHRDVSCAQHATAASTELYSESTSTSPSLISLRPSHPRTVPPYTRPRLLQRAPPAPVPPPGNPRRRSSKTAERSARGDEPGAESLGVKRDGVRGGPADTSGGSPPPSCEPQRPTACPFVFRQIGHQSGGAPRLTQAPSPEDGMRPCAASLKRSNDFARAYGRPLPFLPAFAFSYLASQASRDEARTELQGIGKACRMEAPAVGEPGLSHESREAGLAS